MDNFKKKKKPAFSRSPVDGIITRGSSASPTGGVGFDRSQKSAAQTVGDFKRPDGFHAAQQSVIGNDGSLAVAEVSVADKPDPLTLSAKPRKSSKIKKSRSWKMILKRSAIALATVLVLGGGFVAVKAYIAQKHVFKGGGKAPALSAKVDITKLKGEGDGRINILVLGIGGPGHNGGDLTDTIMLASIDPINHQTSLLSIPRDLWVKIPNDGTQKINAAYTYGKQQSAAKDENGKIQSGLELLDKTLDPVLGIPIHYHIVVNFKAFKQAVDAVGGVTIDVPEQLYDPTIAWENHYNSVIAKKGVQTMGGDQALLYARSRETSTDFARGQRQRALLVGLKEKVFSVSTFSNPVKVSQLLSSFGDNVHTDFSIGDIMRLREIGSQIPSSSITSLDLVTPPHAFLTTGAVNDLSVVKPKAGLFDYTEITNYVRNALKDGFIQQENASIMILNGTTKPGLATAKSAELKSYGYNVTTVADAPTKNYTSTVLVDLRSGQKKYTKNYLEKRLKVTAVNSLPDKAIVPGTADFVIILGSSE